MEKRLKYVNTKEYREGDVPKEEMLAKGGYATMIGVIKDLKEEVKGSKWNTKVLYLKESKRRMAALEQAQGKDEMDAELRQFIVDMPDAWKNLNFSVMTSRQKYQMRKHFANEMAGAMISALTTGGMLDAFLRAGQRFAKLSVSDAVAGINEAYNKYMAEPTQINLAELEKMETELIESDDYTTAAERSDQVEVLKALDFSDQIAPGWRIFNICRAKLNEWETCGITMPAAFWSRPNKNGWRFYCRMDWEVLVQAGAWDGAPDHVKMWAANMVEAYGRNWKSWPQIGCGARFIPWARGASIILELKCGDTWMAMAAVRPPPILLDEIFRVRYEFALRLDAMTPSQIQQVMPICFPMSYLIDGRDGKFPGIAKFPVDQWVKDGRPIFDEAAWCTLCIHLVEVSRKRDQSSSSTQHFTSNLDKLFDIAMDLQSKL